MKDLRYVIALFHVSLIARANIENITAVIIIVVASVIIIVITSFFMIVITVIIVVMSSSGMTILVTMISVPFTLHVPTLGTIITIITDVPGLLIKEQRKLTSVQRRVVC